MAALDDPDVGLPTLLGDPAVNSGCKPVGMDCTVENLKSEVGNPRSTGTHSHVQDLFLC
jgi:hypothetical protein